MDHTYKQKAKKFEKGVNSGALSFADMIQNFKEGISGPLPEERDAMAQAEMEKERKRQAIIRMMTGRGGMGQ